MCDCHSIPECCVMFSGVKLSIRSFNLFLTISGEAPHNIQNDTCCSNVRGFVHIRA